MAVAVDFYISGTRFVVTSPQCARKKRLGVAGGRCDDAIGGQLRRWHQARCATSARTPIRTKRIGVDPGDHPTFSLRRLARDQIVHGLPGNQ